MFTYFLKFLIILITVKTSISISCTSKPCGSLPCLESPSLPNGFICQCGPNNFQAVCVDTLTTTTTPIAPITPCPSSAGVCLNSGVCYLVNGSIRCVCPPSFTDAFCQTPIVATLATTTLSSVVLCPNQNTCFNQGICYLVNGALRCVCPQGFSGTLCEIASTSIVSTTTQSTVVSCPNQNTCFNQGICYLVNGAVRCVCPQGYSGSLCEISPATTPSYALCVNQSTCQNQAVCYIVSNAVRCVCPQGFFGTYCENRV